MKNKLILLFALGFMLMIPSAKADTFAGRYSMPNFDSSGHPLTKNNNVFTFELGLRSSMKYFTYANPIRTFDADYIVFQLNLISIAEPILGTDSNTWDNCVNFFGKDGYLELEGACTVHGWNTHYSYQEELTFSLYVNAMYNNDSFVPCEIMSSFGNAATYKCPVMDKNAKFVGMQFRTDNVGGATGYYQAKISFLDMLYLYKYNSNSDVSEAIKNQTEQQHKDSQAQLEEQKKQTEALTNSNVDVNGDFFNGFDNNTHGLTSVITAPLQLIGSITSSTCSPLTLPMPFGMPSAQLPCMGTIYKNYFGTFFTLYQTITHGFISYWVCVNLFAMVKGFKDPDSDKVEVLDL